MASQATGSKGIPEAHSTARVFILCTYLLFVAIDIGIVIGIIGAIIIDIAAIVIAVVVIAITITVGT